MMHPLACLRAPALALAAAVSLLALGGCGATGSLTGRVEIDPPGLGPIEVIVDIGEDGSTFELQGQGGTPNDYSNKCIEVTWTDASGQVLQVDEIALDGTGHGSGPVPEGAVRWEAAIVDCPEDVEEPEAGKSLAQSGGGTSQLGGRVQDELQPCLVIGGPVIPSDDPNATNLSYAFLVLAASAGQATDLVRPIVAAGIGSNVPASVQVLRWITTESVPAGLRIVTANTEGFARLEVDVNQGAFLEDLTSGLTEATFLGWSYVEVLIPQAALAPVPPLGGTSENLVETVTAGKHLPRLARHESTRVRIEA